MVGPTCRRALIMLGRSEVGLASVWGRHRPKMDLGPIRGRLFRVAFRTIPGRSAAELEVIPGRPWAKFGPMRGPFAFDPRSGLGRTWRLEQTWLRCMLARSHPACARARDGVGGARVLGCEGLPSRLHPRHADDGGRARLALRGADGLSRGGLHGAPDDDVPAVDLRRPSAPALTRAWHVWARSCAWGAPEGLCRSSTKGSCVASPQRESLAIVAGDARSRLGL